MPHRGSFGLVVTLHVLLAVFVIGPLGFVTLVAPWLLRWRPLVDDAGRRAVAAALTATVWAVRVLSACSVLVAALGFVVLDEGTFGSVRSVTDGWILYSIVLWAAALAINLIPLDRMLLRSRSAVGAGDDPRRFVAPLVVAGTASSACWVLVVILMMVKPGA